MTNSYSAANAASRQRLGALVNRLSDAQLSIPLAAGWTVAGVLAHLAFWDLRALRLLETWQHAGIGPSPMDTDIVNDAMRPLLLAIPARAAAQIAVDTAGAMDAAIDALEPAFLSAVEARGAPVRLDRARHRDEHLDEIERALDASAHLERS